MKRLIIYFLISFILAVNLSVYAESEKNIKLEYILTRNGVSYSIDKNNIDIISGNFLLFWLSAQDKNNDRLSIALIAVNIKEHEFRYEEISIYELSTKKLLTSEKNPAQWKYASPESPIDIIVKYIFDNDPRFKE